MSPQEERAQEFILELEKQHQEYESVLKFLRLPAEQKKTPSLLPLGKRGFVRGTIKNTEKTVTLLGCNYMVEGSVDQAIGIIERRFDASKDDLKQLEASLFKIPVAAVPSGTSALAKGESKKGPFSKGFLNSKGRAGKGKTKQATTTTNPASGTPKIKSLLSAKESALNENLLPAGRASERADFVAQMMAGISAKNPPSGNIYEKKNLEGKALEIDGEKIFEVFEETTEEKLQQEKEAKEKRLQDIIVKRRREKGETRKSGVRFIGMETSLLPKAKDEQKSKQDVWLQSKPTADPFFARLQALEAEEKGIKPPQPKISTKAKGPKQAFSGVVAEKDPSCGKSLPHFLQNSFACSSTLYSSALCSFTLFTYPAPVASASISLGTTEVGSAVSSSGEATSKPPKKMSRFKARRQ
jgi:prefoldin alpha subunit